MILNIGFMAMPVGILGNAFTQVWADRDRIIMVAKANQALREYGLAAIQAREFFKKYDLNEDGELTLFEFKHMLEDLRVDLSEARVTQLFEMIDIDGNGQIDQKELIQNVFPSAYHLIYANAENGLRRSTRRSVRDAPALT
eukprot:TRINITY_DN64804_c0_g1_i1.p1 TRINITY_DN64804_c0_g1~~TRINITY_DN64804_c0_g1_i1.p1  ORF type:complete len:141 (+),score=22.72 TRINITY_DN64804_c0_g1_i1:3-425(+)